jgi:hypothetical protein
MLFLRSTVSQNGLCSRVVEVAPRGFSCCEFSYVWIPRTIKLFGGGCFENASISMLAFESPQLFHNSLPTEQVSGPIDRRPLPVFQDIFATCNHLRSLCIPAHIEVLSTMFLARCHDLQVVTFEANSRLTQIDTQAFTHCEVLESIVIPRSVRFIGRFCFAHCFSLQNVIFEADSALVRIDIGAFEDDGKLGWFYIPSHVATIDPRAFAGCDLCDIQVAGDNPHFRVSGNFLVSFDGTVLISGLGLESVVVIPPEIEVIGGGALAGRGSLSRVEFAPDSKLRRIEEWAFGDCTSFCSILLPPFVDAIYGTSFLGCPTLSIQIAEANRYFRVSGDFLLSADGKSVISWLGSAATINIPAEIEILGKIAFANESHLSTVTFAADSKLRRLESAAFFGCSALRSICLPAAVATISGTAFLHTAVRTIQVADGNRHFRAPAGWLLSFDGKSLIVCLSRSAAIQIPREIEVISVKAFSGHRELRELEFEAGSLLRRIEYRAFVACEVLASLYLPSHVDAIDGSAFFFTGIREIRVAEDNPHFRVSGDFLIRNEDNSVVRYFGSAAEVTMLDEIEGLSPWCFAGLWIQILSFGSESRLRRIDSRAFFQCWSIHAIRLPPSVDRIDGSAVVFCGISVIEVAEGNPHFRVCGDFLMTADGKSLIRYLGQDVRIKIGRQIEAISGGAFAFCKQVRRVEFESPSKAKSIGNLAFEKCWSLRSISLPQSIESLSALSFRKARNLQEMRFAAGSKLRRIESEALADCSSLRSLSIPRSAETNEGLDLRGADGFHINWYE